jgi:hypothetical protein
MRCPNCGKRIPKDTIWCDNCGYQKETVQSDTFMPPKEYPGRPDLTQAVKPPKREVNVPRIIVICVIAAIIIVPITISVISVFSSIQEISDSMGGFEIPAPGSEQTADEGVTRDNYDKIHPGMSYNEVVQLFKMQGTVSEADDTDITYAWKAGEAVVTVEFIDDKAVRKDESGL